MRRGVIAVAGGKGGVGKTTTSINLAAVLAGDGTDVVVVELDLGMANVVDFLDLEVEVGDKPTLHDVLAEERAVFEAIRGAPGGFDVLPSGVSLEGFANVEVTRLEWVLEALRGEYDVVLLDTGAGLSEETVFPLKVADGVVLVATPRVAAVRDTEKTRQLAAHTGTDAVGVVFCRSGTGNSPPPERLADFLGADLLGHVPRDEAVPTAQDAGVPVTDLAPDSNAACAYRDVAARTFHPAEGPAGEGPAAGGTTASDRRQSAGESGTLVEPEVASDLAGDDPASGEGAAARASTLEEDADAQGKADDDEEGSESITRRAKQFVTEKFSSSR